MAKPRKEIRKYIVQILKDQVTALDGRVYEFRDSALWDCGEKDYPAINVNLPNESAAPFESSTTRRTYDRTVVLKLEIGVAGKDLADTIDDLCEEVENVFKNDPTLGDMVEEIRYLGTVAVVVQGGAIDVGGAELAFEIQYIR